MQSESYAEYVGLTQDAITALEINRKTPTESRSTILIRMAGLLASVPSVKPENADYTRKTLDFGEGIKLFVGERLYLFITNQSLVSGEADAEAVIKRDGLYMDGKKVVALKGRPFHQAMRQVQERMNHKNEKGEIISLSAIHKWHVFRDGIYKSLLNLKDPKLARTRFTVKKIDDLDLDVAL